MEELRAGKFRGGTGPIGGDDPGEAEIFLTPTGADAGEGHDFEVVRVGADSEMGGGGEGGGEVAPGGKVRLGPRLGKFQRACLRSG